MEAADASGGRPTPGLISISCAGLWSAPTFATMLSKFAPLAWISEMFQTTRHTPYECGCGTLCRSLSKCGWSKFSAGTVGRFAAWVTLTAVLTAGSGSKFAQGGEPHRARADQTAPDPAAVERGCAALTLRGYLKPTWKDDAITKVRKLWENASPDPVADPKGYAAAFRARYGLHLPPYPNDGLPMGLRRGVLRDGTKTGIQLDCLLCHGGSLGGVSYVGLGNTQLDMTLLLRELTNSEGRQMPPSLFILNSARGTNNAGMVSVVLLSLLNSDFSRRVFPLPMGANLPELDVPPWWNLAKKRSMYYDGRTDARSVRSIMQFFMGEKSLDEMKRLEPIFQDVQTYLKSLKPPKYPFPIDRERAEHGRTVFEKTCARCHGTYGEHASYPNKIIPLDVIGTDPARATGLSRKFVEHYNSTWFGKDFPADLEMTGYQAPPLDGIWASAPYLHNGSAPTLWTVLKSKERPKLFLRPPSTEFEHYDRTNVGWKFEPLAEEAVSALTPARRRGLYDASRFGLGNQGHTFGDKLSDYDRREVIEYLKTL